MYLCEGLKNEEYIYHKMYSCSNIINQYDLNTEYILLYLPYFLLYLV